MSRALELQCRRHLGQGQPGCAVQALCLQTGHLLVASGISGLHMHKSISVLQLWLAHVMPHLVRLQLTVATAWSLLDTQMLKLLLCSICDYHMHTYQSTFAVEVY